MKRKLKNIVKTSKIIYQLYFYIGSLFINIMKIFIKSDDKLILFVSFGGKKFDDSPKVIYDSMINDVRFKDYKFAWAFINPDEFDLDIGEKIKIDTWTYYKTALKARCWITNSAIERGLKFKGKNTFYLNTWHGTPIKKMGLDIDSENKSFKSSVSMKAVDVMLAQGSYEVDIFSRVFGIKKENFLLCGLPRNDTLSNATIEQKKEYKRKLGLPEDKKVILYAPTYREYKRDKNFNCYIAPPINFEKWENSLSDDWIVLFRAHYEVGKILNVSNSEFVIDVSQYDNLNELMIASDILISDYSSVFFDYCIQDKPMICFAYDYSEYSVKRGMYFDIRKELIGGEIDQLKLLEIIENFSYNEGVKSAVNFRCKYIQEYGNATKATIECINNNINK